MNFLNPLFLFGLAAAALPIVIHLFTRRRPREVRFPSLEFLAEVHQSEIRRLKLRQWLLLALRTLAIAAIAMAMARPALRGHLGARGSAATTVVALVDVSGSMQAASGAGGQNHTLADGARHVVDDLLSTLGPGDEMLLIPYDRTPRPVTPRPSGDLPRLRAALRFLESGAAATDHATALAFAAHAIGEAHALNRELFWISDFQASGVSDLAALRIPPATWAGTRIYLTALEAHTRANAAITEAVLAPSEGGAALAVEGASFGATPGDLAVTVRTLARTRRPAP